MNKTSLQLSNKREGYLETSEKRQRSRQFKAKTTTQVAFQRFLY